MRLWMQLYCIKWLSIHCVLSLLLIIFSDIPSPSLINVVLNALKFHLKLHDLLVSESDLLFGVSDLSSNHQFCTLCSNTGPRKRRLKRSPCIRIVTLFVDLAPKIMLLHLKVIYLLDKSHIFFQNPLILL